MKKSFVFPLLLAAGLAVEGAQADALAVDPNAIADAARASVDVTYGYAFTVEPGFSYSVTALGVFDTASNGSGLVGPHPVGIWDSTGTTLLASATVPSGTAGTPVPSNATFSGTPVGTWRFVDLGTPLLLSPGDYLIGAFYPGIAGGDPFLDVPNTSLGTVNRLSGITLIGGRRASGSSLTAPTPPVSQSVFGPSMLMEQAIVNPDLTVSISGQSTDTTPVAEGPAGVFSFTVTYCNKSASPTLEALVSSTRVLSNGNSLVNRDRDGSGTPVGGVGSELDFPLTPDYDDGLLAATECVDVPYEIGLSARSRFQFNVDLFGIEGIAAP